jgi:hypothetical protein
MWVGWYRLTEGSPWRRACQAPTLGECSRHLSEATRGMKLRNTDLIMTGGGYPRVPRPRGGVAPQAVRGDSGPDRLRLACASG